MTPTPTPSRARRLLYQLCVLVIVVVLGVAIALDEPAGEGELVTGEVVHASSTGGGQHSLTVKTPDGMVRVTSEQPVGAGESVTLRERRTSIFKRKRHSIELPWETRRRPPAGGPPEPGSESSRLASPRAHG